MPLTLFDEVADYSKLLSAWGRVRRSGLRSQSERTKASVKAFDIDKEARVSEIAQSLRDDTFSFGAARGVPISRPGKDPRPLVVPEIPARIVQRSLLDTLLRQETVSAYVSRPRSFGGLRFKGRRDAIRCAAQAVADGATYFVGSDIRGFFTRILRREVLETIQQLLPDASISDLLDQATSLELSNVDEIGELIHLFPDDDEGVAQGCCLSPLLGNVCMYEFDEAMNAGDIVTIRYIDDFLILGPDRRSTEEAFRKARRSLEAHNLGAYLPADGTGKASEGSPKHGFDFLGCTITPDIVEPSRAARSQFLARVKAKLDEAAHRLAGGAARSERQYNGSLVETLSLASRMIRAWTEQYRFCNPTDAFRSVDLKVDRLVDRYMQSFFKQWRRRRTTPEERRRMLGIWLATDGLRSPILPIPRD